MLPHAAPRNSGPTPPARLVEALLLAAAFAVAHTQSPLYYSNQNQYLLHGAALAGHGHLAHDWLANTRDPTPLFSLLVAVAFRANVWLLQPAYFLLLMGYFLAARRLVAAVPGFPDTRAARVAFAALFTAAHAAILRWASVQVAGVDYPWYFQAGLAAQYMLGPGIQPSAFGVLLLAAVAEFAHGKPERACALAALACLFHSTYLLPAALVVVGILVELARARQYRAALAAGGVALAVAVPVVAYALWRFSPFDPHAEESLHVLADVRIPHHTKPARWFDGIAALQLVWIALGLYFVRREPFGRALAVAALGGAILTAVQIATGSDALALAFPWRISVLLVPVATAVISAKLLARKPPGKVGEWLSVAGLLALAAGGVVVMACGLGYRTADERELYDRVRAAATAGDVYLLPVQWPKVGSGRGAVSNTFAPPPRAKADTNQIPVDLQRFRLATGARVYVDFKSVPYAAEEVLEWRRRMDATIAFYAKPGREWLRREGVTRVVSPTNRPLAADYLREEFAGGGYVVYRVE
jgi:hypothetical protein